MRELQAIIRRLVSRGEGAPDVLATLVAVEGSSYRRPGARLLAASDGGRIGSISGGCLEEDVLARAARVAASGRPELAEYDTSLEDDLLWGVGLGCHGQVRVLLERLPARPAWAAVLEENLRAGRPTEIEVVWQAEDPESLGTRLRCASPRPARSGAGVFREVVAPPPAFFIFGAGDDARPLARWADDLGWRVVVADSRPALATAERFPGAALVVGPAESLVARATPGPAALAVVMTHRYADDRPVLRDLLPLPLAYLGLLGPRKRAEKILSDLAAAGTEISAADRARLHAPVGLDLGAENPVEVALSIVAEARAALSDRDGRPLRDRIGPIHNDGTMGR